MKTIKTQEQLDKLTTVKVGEEVVIESTSILVLKARIEVYGSLRIRTQVSMGKLWQSNIIVARENSSVEAWENSSVEAWENSSVVAWGNSSVVAWGNSSVVARGNSSVVARENSSVVAWENSSVEAWGNSSVVARENSSVEARENSSVEAWGNSSVEAWGNSSVVAWGNSSVEARENSSVEAWGWSIIRYFATVKLDIKSEFCHTIKYEQIFKTKSKTTVYKKLSCGDIATLQLKKGAIFQSENHSKCRTGEALVTSIEDKDGNKIKTGRSQYDISFIYEVGKIVSAPYDDRIEECSTGIHFFLTKEEAERYP